MISNYLSIPKLQWCNHWNLRISSHTLLGVQIPIHAEIKLIRVSKRDPRFQGPPWSLLIKKSLNLCFKDPVNSLVQLLRISCIHFLHTLDGCLCHFSSFFLLKFSSFPLSFCDSMWVEPHLLPFSGIVPAIPVVVMPVSVVCHSSLCARLDMHLVCIHIVAWSGPRFNIKMSSYQHRKSHCGDKTVVRSSYLHNGISYTGKMSSLYWIRAQVVWPVVVGVYFQNFILVFILFPNCIPRN